MIKRFIDVLFSIVGLIVLLPVLLVIACLVYYKLGSPVLFRQIRPGLDGKPFQLIKFRSMICVSNENKEVPSDVQRITRFGNMLRASSLDELPELWCVLKGDMSLVGPRPLLMEYLSLYTAEQFRRHAVRPGITGWAQVNGRNSLDWEERFRLDVWYVENCSLWLDLKILYMTIKRVLKREGITAEGDATMPKFTGSQCQEKK